jgi:hypothetical protein
MSQIVENDGDWEEACDTCSHPTSGGFNELKRMDLCLHCSQGFLVYPKDSYYLLTFMHEVSTVEEEKAAIRVHQKALHCS